MPNVIIESSDKNNFTVDEKIAKMSATIMAMLDDLGFNSIGQNEEKISLPNVRGEILQKVIDWCVYHQGDPAGMYVRGTALKFDQWDEEFFKMERDVFIELTSAAFSLKIEGLKFATARCIANMIKGKTAEEIRRMFNIKNDFAPGQEDKFEEEFEFFMRNM